MFQKPPPQFLPQNYIFFNYVLRERGSKDTFMYRLNIVLQNDPSVSQSVFTITEKAPTRAWLKAATSALTFKTL